MIRIRMLPTFLMISSLSTIFHVINGTNPRLTESYFSKIVDNQATMGIYKTISIANHNLNLRMSLSRCASKCRSSLSCQGFIWDPSETLCIIGELCGAFHNSLHLGNCSCLTDPTLYLDYHQPLYIETRQCNSKLGYERVAYSNTVKCLRLIEQDTIYSTAQEDCRSTGGQLVTMNTLDSFALIRQYMNSKTIDLRLVAWIGLTDTKIEGEYIWLNGKRMSEMEKGFFLVGEPNDKKHEENCIEVQKNENAFGLNDNSCLAKHGYICEIVY